MSSSLDALDRQRHVRYFCYCLRQLPMQYSALDTNRLTLVHFAIQALDLLGVLDEDVNNNKCPIDKEAISEWIWSLQTPQQNGFQGGTTWFPSDSDNDNDNGNLNLTERGEAHIAMTYTALCTLQTLNYSSDWTIQNSAKINKQAIVHELQQLQRDDGSYQCCVHSSSEHDMRFLYCACCISYMINDWSGVDIPKAVEYIVRCKSYDGSIALLPGQEGHGGSTFCGIASLKLMGQLDDVFQQEQHSSWKQDLLQWCTSRQIGGMQGRPNKLEDTCYSYWIGGTLALLLLDNTTTTDDADEDESTAEDRLESTSSLGVLLDCVTLRDYVLQCQHSQFGGFGKVLHANPDVLHSFYSLAWLSIDDNMNNNDNYVHDDRNQDETKAHTETSTKRKGLKKLNVMLGICQDKAIGFEQQHQQHQEQ